MKYYYTSSPSLFTAVRHPMLDEGLSYICTSILGHARPLTQLHTFSYLHPNFIPCLVQVQSFSYTEYFNDIKTLATTLHTYRITSCNEIHNLDTVTYMQSSGSDPPLESIDISIVYFQIKKINIQRQKFLIFYSRICTYIAYKQVSFLLSRLLNAECHGHRSCHVMSWSSSEIR